jgi:hypothetical protein
MASLFLPFRTPARLVLEAAELLCCSMPREWRPIRGTAEPDRLEVSTVKAESLASSRMPRPRKLLSEVALEGKGSGLDSWASRGSWAALPPLVEVEASCDIRKRTTQDSAPFSSDFPLTSLEPGCCMRVLHAVLHVGCSPRH